MRKFVNENELKTNIYVKDFPGGEVISKMLPFLASLMDILL